MSVNKVILVGNLGDDPRIKFTANQLAICNFSIATNERRKIGEGWEDHVEWHSIVVFGGSAENCEKHLRKGSLVYVEGKINSRKWQDKEGRDCYKTEIVCENIKFLGHSTKKDTVKENVENSKPIENLKKEISYIEQSLPYDDIPF